MKGIERARDWKRWERWRVEGKRERKLQAVEGEFKWNQVGSLPVCVCVCVEAGSYVYGGGLAACVCVWIFMLFSVVELDTFGILEFGPQTRNFHPGGSDEEGSGGGGWPCRGAVWGSEWAVPLSSLPSFPPLHTFTVQLSVSTLTLSGWGVRIEEKTCHREESTGRKEEKPLHSRTQQEESPACEYTTFAKENLILHCNIMSLYSSSCCLHGVFGPLWISSSK